MNDLISEKTLDVLRKLVDGPMTTAELCAFFGKLQAGSALSTLRRRGYVDSDEQWRTSMNTITRSGLRRAAPQDGPIALPRMPVSADTYKGERAITTRPGAMDAYHRPSRRGDNYLPHARPISLASRVQDTKFR